jgi:PAS domain S-box-containing protein
MPDHIEDRKLAIIGGGKRCRSLLEAIYNVDPQDPKPAILGVADKDPTAVGLLYAKERGIYTTDNYSELFAIEEVDLIVELTPDDSLKRLIKEAKPPGVRFVDHHESRSILDCLRIRSKKAETLRRVRTEGADIEKTEALIEALHDFVQEINDSTNAYSRETRNHLMASEGMLSQIIGGSTIPIFVIDKEHKVTHWNRACERLTGYAAADMIGTDNQWKPFRSKKRPTMADLILDGITEEELWRHYSTRWEKSALIGGGYEVEEFFSHLGKDGKHLFFTAVPIKTPDGAVVGAMETLWDQTRQKLAEEERERNNVALAKKVEELKTNQKAMSQIIDGSTIPTFVIDKDHTISHWNKAMEGLTGFPSLEMVGTRRQWAPFYEEERPSMADVILDQVDAAQIQRLYGSKWRKSALIDGAYEAELFFPNLGHHGKWCWFTAAPIKNEENEVVGAIETIWDKTEDHKVEEEREQHTRELATFCSIYATLSGPLDLQERIRAAIEEVANIFGVDGICIFIRDGQGRYCLRYSHGYSENLCYSDRVAASDSMVMQTALVRDTRVFNNLPPAEGVEIPLLEKEGLQSLVYLPILDKSKQTFGVVRVASRAKDYFDANAIRALELIANRIGVAIENALLQEDVARQANFQSRLIGSSNDGIVATDEKGKILIFNPAAEEIFGCSAEAVIGTTDARELLPDHVVEAFDRVRTSHGDTLTMPWHETKVQSRDAEQIPVLFSGTVLKERHKIIGSVAFVHDLREIKRLEKELISAERLAAVGQTVAGLAHCVKNILHGLKGGSYLVDLGINKNKMDKLKSGWDMVQRNITLTHDLVQDLLSYSKEREPEYEPCRPNEIADDVCELMQGVAQTHLVTIEKRFSPDVHEVVLDPRTVHRCLLNLVSNAIDACRDDPDPNKEHRVIVETTMQKDAWIRFAVRDNGSGMSEEVRSKLFASFFSTKGAKGTGLGLLVTGKLIEENRGTIDVDSTEGEGTCFTIRLPIDGKANPTDS